jgi:hypothetical protein
MTIARESMAAADKVTNPDLDLDGIISSQLAVDCEIEDRSVA